MGLSEQLKGWDRIKAGGCTDSFTKVNESGTKQAWVRSLDYPGEWYVVWMDLASKKTDQTPSLRGDCFTSLMTALQFAEGQLQ